MVSLIHSGVVRIIFFVNNRACVVPNRNNIFIRLPKDDRFQPEYDKSIKYLDVLARINSLNRRLEVLKDLNAILMDAAQNNYAATLEWIVIMLIIAWLSVAQ
jgi:hypothetical protein